jgi:hypothetical protein
MEHLAVRMININSNCMDSSPINSLVAAEEKCNRFNLKLKVYAYYAMTVFLTG